jgi:Uma2 family endonuclease
MGLALKSDVERYTYHDYLQWPENERWELIEGIAYDMSPAPSPKHQEILGELYRQISNYLLDKTCKVYMAPFDVRLPEVDEKEKEIKTVLQPDISIICDPAKIDEKGCLGSPDLVMEIVSPATVQKDMKEKFFTYERFGIKEYWIIHPVDQILMVFKRLLNGKYGRPEIYSPEDKVKVGILPDLTSDLAMVFKGL